jgi:hypothetical protein
VFKIPNTLLVETLLPFRILSPQHLSQEHRKSKVDTMKSGTRAIVGDNEVVLQCANCQFKKTIPINKRNNIPIMQSASGFCRYKSFASSIEADDREITCFDTHIIPDNKSLVPEHSKEDIIFTMDQNPSATTRSTPTFETLMDTSTPMVAAPMGQSTDPSTGPHAIETFEVGLPQQDYEQVESKPYNPTHELL